MTTQHTAQDLDQRARAYYRDAQTHLSARTMAELHRRRISLTSADASARTTGGWFGGRLMGAALASLCALVIGLGWWRQDHLPPEAPTPMMTWEALDANDALEALDALDAITLTALDEDSEFFLWFATHEASLLAME